jgi:hypothetical protein
MGFPIDFENTIPEDDSVRWLKVKIINNINFKIERRQETINIANAKVNRIKFGLGIITDVEEHKILVQFKDNIGVKAFLYPEA